MCVGRVGGARFKSSIFHIIFLDIFNVERSGFRGGGKGGEISVSVEATVRERARRRKRD